MFDELPVGQEFLVDFVEGRDVLPDNEHAVVRGRVRENPQDRFFSVFNDVDFVGFFESFDQVFKRFFRLGLRVISTGNDRVVGVRFGSSAEQGALASVAVVGGG